jgi:glycosyltransferase involved in cell wall biosynthesis
MKNTIKEIFAYFGLKISKLNTENPILKNVYQTDFEQTVLISYLRAPFLTDMIYSHTNYTECKTAADIFNELGFKVDVIEFTNDDFEINFSDYNVIYGFGCPFERAFFSSHAEKLKKVMYSTGCNAFYAHNKSALRVYEMYHKTRLLMPQSSRVVDYFWTFQYINSDLIIALGNDFVASTYRKTNPSIKVVSVNAFYFDVFDIEIKKKEFETARKNFLWFGSGGLLHKGLDVVIDIFAKRPDIKLHICGASKHEEKFWEHYRPVINACQNITDYGFIDISSNTFKDIMLTCGSFIFPTVSEGGAPSALNVMANGGLIPIISEGAGIDINEFGYVFKEINEDSIIEQIDKVLSMDRDDFFTKATLCKKAIRSNHNYMRYKENLKNAICYII